MYIPLKQEGNKFVEVKSPVNWSTWLDPDFLLDFERQLDRYYQKLVGTVVLNCVEYSDCVIFSPKEKAARPCYTKVHDNGLPFRNNNNGTLPSEKLIYNGSVSTALEEVTHSDYLCDKLRTELSYSYLPPFYEFEGESESLLISTVDILKHPRVLIQGEPGCGKTSLVRRLAFDLNTKINDADAKNRTVAVYFKLRDYERPTFTLEDAAAKLGCPNNTEYALAKSERGQLVYIFDGLDELNKEDRSNFIVWLNHYAKNQSSVRVVVTSRILREPSRDVFAGFHFCKIKPFRKSQIFEFCTRHFTNSKVRDSYLDYIAGDAQLLTFLSNPLMLNVSLVLFENKKVFPYNTGELVEQITKYLTESWDENRGIHRYELLNARAVRMLLAKLAHRLQLKGDFTFDAKDVHDLLPFEQEKTPPINILNEVRTSTGLLRHDAGKWSFSHRLFQDFFCASYIIETVGKFDGQTALNRSEWASVWRQVAELCSDPEFVVDHKTESLSDALFSLDRILAVLLTKNRFDRLNLDSFLLEGRKSLRLLDQCFSRVRIHRGSFEITVSKTATIDMNVLVNAILNCYYLSKEETRPLARRLFSRKSTLISQALCLLFGARSVPIFDVAEKRLKVFTKAKPFHRKK